MGENTILSLDEIDWKGILKDLWRNLLVILLAMLSAIMLSVFYFHTFYQEEYTSEATIAIINNSSGYSSYSANDTYAGLSTSTRMASALSRFFTSGIMFDKLAEDLGYEPRGELQVSQIENTNLVLLKMSADTAQEAYKELQTVFENYEKYADDIFNNATLSVLNKPSVPQKPSNQVSVIIYGGLAAIAAFIVCIVFIIIASIRRRTVKTKASAEKWLNIRVYGVIGHEKKYVKLGKDYISRFRIKKQKAALLVTNPLCSFGFEETLMRLVSRIVFHMEHNHQQVLLITSSAKNEGKSTILSNIALVMAKRKKKVLLIDADFRKPALYKVFDYHKTGKEIVGLDEYIKGDIELQEMLIHDDKSGLTFALVENASQSPESLISSPVLKRFIAQMREQFDYILVDSPPAGMIGDAELITDWADAALFVVRHDYIALHQINDILEHLSQSGIDLLGCVLNDMNTDSLDKQLKKSEYHGYAKNKISSYGTKRG